MADLGLVAMLVITVVAMVITGMKVGWHSPLTYSVVYLSISTLMFLTFVVEFDNDILISLAISSLAFGPLAVVYWRYSPIRAYAQRRKRHDFRSTEGDQRG